MKSTASARALGTVALAALLGGFTLPGAQTKPSRVGFVSSPALLAAHPGGKVVLKLRQDAQAELEPLQKQGTELQAKVSAGQATAAERDKLVTLKTTITARYKVWQDRVAKATDPIAEDVNAAVAAAAREQGFGMVLDKDLAGQGLVIYADDSLDLTDEAVKKLKK